MPPRLPRTYSLPVTPASLPLAAMVTSAVPSSLTPATLPPAATAASTAPSSHTQATTPTTSSPSLTGARHTRPLPRKQLRTMKIVCGLKAEPKRAAVPDEELVSDEQVSSSEHPGRRWESVDTPHSSLAAAGFVPTDAHQVLDGLADSWPTPLEVSNASKGDSGGPRRTLRGSGTPSCGSTSNGSGLPQLAQADFAVNSPMFDEVTFPAEKVSSITEGEDPHYLNPSVDLHPHLEARCNEQAMVLPLFSQFSPTVQADRSAGVKNTKFEEAALSPEINLTSLEAGGLHTLGSSSVLHPHMEIRSSESQIETFPFLPDSAAARAERLAQIKARRNPFYEALLKAGLIEPESSKDTPGTQILMPSSMQQAPTEATAPGLEEKLGKLAPAHAVAGTISPYFVKRFNFKNDCLVIQWSGDNPNSLAGNVRKLIGALG